MVRIVVVVAACMLAACNSYFAVGYAPTTAVHGPLATLMPEQATARKTMPVADTSDVAAPTTGTYALGIGGGARNFTIGLGLEAHDVSSASFAVPSAATLGTGPHYLTGSAALDVQCTWLRWHHVSSSLHAGPAAMALLDRTSGELAWGKGMRYGAQLGVTLSIVTAFVDFSRTAVVFDDGPASGFSDVTAVLVGLQLR